MFYGKLQGSPNPIWYKFSEAYLRPIIPKVFNFHQRKTSCSNPIISQIDSCHNNLPKATKASKSMPSPSYSRGLLKKKEWLYYYYYYYTSLPGPSRFTGG